MSTARMPGRRSHILGESWPAPDEAERERRAELHQAREALKREWRTTRNEWALYIAVLIASVVAAALFKAPWFGPALW